MKFFTALRRAAFSCLALMVLSFPAFASHTVISVTESDIGALTRTEWVVQDGDLPINRFSVVRVRLKNLPAQAFIQTLLLMPGGGSNFDLYEVDENGEYRNSIVGYLAYRAIDVWGISPRSKFLTAASCAPVGTVDCAPAANWGIASIVSDAAYAREQIRAVHGSKKPVVGGYSLGAITSLAVVNAAPNDYAGLVLWEGILQSMNPEVIAANQALCAAVDAQLQSGVIFDNSFVTLKFIVGLASAAPNDPSPFFPGLTNLQAVLGLLTTPLTAPPAHVPDYLPVAGSLAGLTYSSFARLAVSNATFNDLQALVVTKDIACSIAGATTEFVGNLAQFTGPVLAIEAGRGFGPHMADQLAVFSGTKTVLSEPAFGHGDHFNVVDHKRYVDRPIFIWLAQNRR